MKKVNISWIVIDLIFLAVFNILFFLLGGTDHNISVWLSFGFIHFSYIMLLLTPFFVRKGKSSAIFGFSLYTVSGLYFLIELITGVIFILVSSEQYAVSLFVQLVLVGIYVVLLISNMIANNNTAISEMKHEEELNYVKTATSRLAYIMSEVNDEVTKKKIEVIYDIVKGSPIKSHPSVSALECEIMQKIDNLKDSVLIQELNTVDSQVTLIRRMVVDRNSQLKLLN